MANALIRGMVLAGICAAVFGCAKSPDKQLAEATQEAGSGHYLKAVVIAEDLPSDSAAYASVQKLLPDWKQHAAVALMGDMMGGAAANADTGAKSAEVKSNAYKVQTMIESFGVDHNGTYPKDAATLLSAAKAGGYSKDLDNPFSDSGPAVVDGDHPAPGAVGYKPTDGNTAYVLVGWDGEGTPLTDKKGKIFELNN